MFELFCFVEVARETVDGSFPAEVRQRGAGAGAAQQRPQRVPDRCPALLPRREFMHCSSTRTHARLYYRSGTVTLNTINSKLSVYSNFFKNLL